MDPRKRVHLDLEDLTPDDVCHNKQDQLHVEDPAGGHKLLLKCWREAKFTSSTNTLEVVLLIGGWPSAPYRGFYARYHAFGPPVVYNPEEEPTGDAPDPEQVEADLMAEEPEREEEVSRWFQTGSSCQENPSRSSSEAPRSSRWTCYLA